MHHFLHEFAFLYFTNSSLWELFFLLMLRVKGLSVFIALNWGSLHYLKRWIIYQICLFWPEGEWRMGDKHRCTHTWLSLLKLLYIQAESPLFGMLLLTPLHTETTHMHNWLFLGLASVHTSTWAHSVISLRHTRADRWEHQMMSATRFVSHGGSYCWHYLARENTQTYINILCACVHLWIYVYAAYRATSVTGAVNRWMNRIVCWSLKSCLYPHTVTT